MRLFHILFVVFVVLFPQLAQAQEEGLPFEIPKDPSTLPQIALMKTTKGPIEIKLFGDISPITVRNFEYLAKKGFYEQIKFHRYEPGFVIQGGDPEGTGKGGPGHTLPPEFSRLKHKRGTVGMARKSTAVNPERRSSGSQFYICLKRARHLDGMYTIFGQVVSGMENVEELRKGDRILGISFPSPRFSSSFSENDTVRVSVDREVTQADKQRSLRE